MSCCSPNKNRAKEDDHNHNHPKQQDSCCSSPKKSTYYQEEEKQSSGCCSAPKKSSDQNQEENQGGGCCSAPKKNKNSGATKITREMTIDEILGLFPYKAQKLSQELANSGLNCVGCHASTWETLESGMYSHSKNDDQIEDLLRRLNALLAEEVDTSTITITARGASKFLEFATEGSKQGWGIRFSEEMAGCSGFEYVLDFEEKATADDQVFVSNGIEIYVKKAMVSRLIGCEIDYVDGLRGSGFKISNPNVNSSCGCGSSHGY